MATVPATKPAAPPATAQKAAAEATPLDLECIDTFEVAGAALEKAAAAYEQREAEKKAIAVKIPEVVQELVLSGLINPEDKTAMANALRDPLQALETVKLASETYRKRTNGNSLPATQVDQEGRPAREKTAGARRDWREEREAQFQRDMGSD